MTAYPNHQDIRPAYQQETDPGAVGAGVHWLVPSTGQEFSRNDANSGWITLTGPPSGAAGGVLSGTYPNPGFAVDMATQAELDAEASTRATADALLTPLTRNINTTVPLTGGGNLSADRTLAISDFVASGASHARGAVPDPGVTAGTTKFLREDATFVVPGGRSAADKIFLATNFI